MKKSILLFTLLSVCLLMNSCKDSIEEINNALIKETFFYIRNDQKNEKSSWINNIKFNSDKSCVINCYLSKFCGEHEIKCNYDEIVEFDFDEMDSNFKNEFSYLENESCFKIPLIFNSEEFYDCDWDIASQTHFKSNKNPTINFSIYPFALIFKNKETQFWELTLVTNNQIFEGNSYVTKLNLRSWEFQTKSDRIKDLSSWIKENPTDEEMKAELNLVKNWTE